jgi:hypothetical protein
MPMVETSTNDENFIDSSARLLELFNLIPDIFFQNEGITPPVKVIEAVIDSAKSIKADW